MSNQRFDSSRWTGDLSLVGQPLDPETARARLRWALPLLVLLAFTLAFIIGWQVLWRLSGSPPVFDAGNPLDLFVPLTGGLAGYAFGRWWRKWPLMCAVVACNIAFGVYTAGAYLLDLYLPSAHGEQRAFVESAAAPRYPPRRRVRLGYEMRLSVLRRAPVEASIPEALYRNVVGGDTCLLIRWRGGRHYRFFEGVRHLPTGDGDGSWVDVPKDRENCLSGRPL